MGDSDRRDMLNLYVYDLMKRNNMHDIAESFAHNVTNMKYKAVDDDVDLVGQSAVSLRETAIQIIEKMGISAKELLLAGVMINNETSLDPIKLEHFEYEARKVMSNDFQVTPQKNALKDEAYDILRETALQIIWESGVSARTLTLITQLIIRAATTCLFDTSNMMNPFSAEAEATKLGIVSNNFQVTQVAQDFMQSAATEPFNTRMLSQDVYEGADLIVQKLGVHLQMFTPEMANSIHESSEDIDTLECKLKSIFDEMYSGETNLNSHGVEQIGK